MSWPHFWKKPTWQSYLLWPLSQLVCWEAGRRLRKFRHQPPVKPQAPQSLKRSQRIIVVGNIVVGGTGKTPFILWLVQQLQQQGFRVGIISRGYGAKNNQWPQWVDENSNASQVGDEPYMLAQQTGCPVAVSPNRVEALQLLNAKSVCDIVISDDGLQHYALARDIEIVLIDAERQFGNGWCLPAGPLREPISRLQQVDFSVWNGLSVNEPVPELDVKQKYAASMQLQPIGFCRVDQLGQKSGCLSVDEFMALYPARQLSAIAGIGNPQRFFNSLMSMGFDVKSKAYPDHYAYQTEDFSEILTEQKQMNSNQVIKPLVMTEKDAVKCQTIAKGEAHCWYLQIAPQCSDELMVKLLEKLAKV